MLGAAGAQSSDESTGALQGGGQYIAHRDPGAATTAIDLWYRVPSAGYEGATPGIARLTLAALAVSSPPHSNTFADLVKRSGGTLSIQVFPDIAEVGASVPSWQAPAVLKAMTAAYFAPAVTDAGLRTALRDCAIAAAEAQFNTEQTLQDALLGRLFSAGPAHYPPVPPSAADFAKITLAQANAFASRGLRQPNAVLSVAGALDQNWLSEVHTVIAPGSTAADAPLDSTLAPAPGDVTAPAQTAGLGFAWAGPPIADVKAATAMDFIADYLFDSVNGTLSKAISSSNDLYAAGQFITLHDPGVLVATVSGTNASSARPQIVQAVSAMAKPLDPVTFEAARNAFVYHIVSESQTPSSRADNAGWYAAEGNAAYAPGDVSREYFAQVQALDPAYVASVAAKYLRHPEVVQLLAAPRSGSST